jgi:hypothetical protein
MPVKNYLKTDEKQKLQNELKYNEHPDIRERILLLLLQNDGKTQQEIALEQPLVAHKPTLNALESEVNANVSKGLRTPEELEFLGMTIN